MSAVANLAALLAAVRGEAQRDASAAAILVDRYAADELAHSLRAPAGSYAVATASATGQFSVSAGWQAADRVLIVLPTRNGVGGIAIFDRADPRLNLSAAQPDFGLDDAVLGWLVATPPLTPADAIDVPAATAANALMRHHFVAETLHLGLISGTLDAFFAAAIAFLKARPSPWYGAGIERATDDPHVLRCLGLLLSRRQALDELITEAVAAVTLALQVENPPQEIGALDIARHHAQHLARGLISEGIGLLGASAASGKYGFDRFWRDIAAHHLRHPAPKDAEALGRDFVRQIHTSRPTRVTP